MKIDAVILQHYNMMHELNEDKKIGTLVRMTQLNLREATIFGLEQAKNILLGKG